MTLDELRGLIAFLRGGMSDRDKQTAYGSRESQDPSTMSVAGGRDHNGRTGDGSGESHSGEDPPPVLIVEGRELRRFAKLKKQLLQAAVKLKKDPHEMQLLVIRHLVFGCDDTILITKTGFGKSLTFQAFTVVWACGNRRAPCAPRLGLPIHNSVSLGLCLQSRSGCTGVLRR